MRGSEATSETTGEIIDKGEEGMHGLGKKSLCCLGVRGALRHTSRPAVWASTESRRRLPCNLREHGGGRGRKVAGKDVVQTSTRTRNLRCLI